MRLQRMSARRAFFLHAIVAALCSGLIFTGLSAYYVRTVGMDPLQLVLVGTAIELTCFIFEVPTGVVADIYSRRLSSIIGGVLVGVCYVLTGLAPVFAIIVIAEVIRGIGETFISGAFDAWITDEVGAENVGLVFLRGGQLWQAASLVGVGLSVLLATVASYSVPIVLGGLGLIALNVFLAFTMPETGFKPTPRGERSTFRAMFETLRDGAVLVRATPVLLLLLVAEAIRGASSEGFDRLWEALILTGYALPVLSLPVIGPLDPIAWFAVLEVIGAILAVTVLEVARRRINMQSHAALARTLMAAYAVAIVATLVLALSGNFALAMAMLVVRGLCWSLAGPVAGTWLNQSIADSRVRATVLSMNSQSNAFGQIAGGPMVGAIGRGFGIRSAIGVSALLLAPTLALFGRTLRRKVEAMPAHTSEAAPAGLV